MLFADAIMALGFRHAFRAGISFGKDDMVIPEDKVRLVDETRALVKDYEQPSLRALRMKRRRGVLAPAGPTSSRARASRRSCRKSGPAAETLSMLSCSLWRWFPIFSATYGQRS